MTTANTDLRAYMEGQVKQKHGRRRTGVIVGLVLNVVVLGYLSWLHSQVSYITQPDNLAAAASGLVVANIPNMKEAMVATVKAEAPSVAEFVADAVRNEVPSLLRKQIESLVLEYIGGLASYVSEQYNASFTDILDLAEPELKKAIAANSDAERDIAVMQFLEKQVDAAVANLNAKNAGNDATLSQLEASHSTLLALNKKIQAITTSSDKAPRKTQLEKRFLYTLWRFIQNQHPEISDAPEEAPALADPVK